MKDREQKHKEALERQKRYDALSIEEKKQQCIQRPGHSRKERQRLRALTKT